MSPEFELELFDLDQALTGYREFISCWLYRDPRISLVVDPGPASSAAGLVDRLRAAGVDELDLILLTHIHLDHGGGTAELLAAFPRARWCSHPKGVAHLLEPDRLWEGSLATIGEGRPQASATLISGSPDDWLQAANASRNPASTAKTMECLCLGVFISVFLCLLAMVLKRQPHSSCRFLC